MGTEIIEHSQDQLLFIETKRNIKEGGLGKVYDLSIFIFLFSAWLRKCLESTISGGLSKKKNYKWRDIIMEKEIGWGIKEQNLGSLEYLFGRQENGKN